MPGLLARNRLTAAATIVALALGKVHKRTRPSARCLMAATCSAAALRSARIVSVCRDSSSPASVSRRLRPERVNNGVPTLRSSARICWLIAGWV